ncbi:MAG: fluoride efflux transporter CrcB [Clostridium sp.]|nr:fluoride efflux transporter CrcB [Prevotella sp.]MCM1428766.1 fluoride efflux transporter CrcB [Clostridium sp.]MCM1475141.1 fluoride efflux transporter CrcB [Muribaculaceae bacterium]
MLKDFVAIFLGGGLGSVMRYGMQLIMHERIATYHFPWATFSVNIIGSFLIGLFYAVSARFNLSEETRLFLTAGLCGGFTTFSTFSNDTLSMLRTGDWLPAIIYIFSSILVGIVACMAGGYLGLSSR